MVSYRTGDVLFEAVQAVLAQTEPVELCLVDNGNPPEVVSKLQDMALSDPRLKLITGHGNVGFGKACNMGAKIAKGDFFLFLNPDSLLPSEAVAKLKNYALFLKSPFMLGARLKDEAGYDQRGCRRALLTPTTAFIEALHLGALFPKARLNFDKEPIPEIISPMPAISGAFMFLPRMDFKSIGGFDEEYFLHVEDLDFCLRFNREGGIIYFVPDIVVTHIGGTSKTTTAFIEKHKARGFSQYFHKNFSDYPSLMLLALDVAIWLRAGLKIGLSWAK
ncbi:MAG: glycosyltransferase family 2 protein [Alphaproteobacteria bacterium]